MTKDRKSNALDALQLHEDPFSESSFQPIDVAELAQKLAEGSKFRRRKPTLSSPARSTCNSSTAATISQVRAITTSHRGDPASHRQATRTLQAAFRASQRQQTAARGLVATAKIHCEGAQFRAGPSS